jgi:type I restriction enzyme R subunit
MPNQGTESQFEATTIDRLLALLGYRYQYGGDLERDWRDVVMADWLRAFLAKHYPHVPAAAMEEAIQRASRPEGITTEQRNKHFHELLTHGFEQPYEKPDGNRAVEHIHLVDWAHPLENDLCVVNQLPIRGQNDRRPDIIIYLNGFPVVLFELKNPYEENPNTLGAFNQVQHYKAGISQLFDYNALVVISDGGMVGHATDDTPRRRLRPARHVDLNLGMVCPLEKHQRPRRGRQFHRRHEDPN